MTRALVLTNGVPRMTQISEVNIYDESVVLGADQSAGYTLTLPSAATYISSDLEVYLEGQFLEPGVDYLYVGTGTRTQIEMVESLREGDRIRFRVEGNPDTIYDETTVIGSGGISTGTPITLPSSKTFTGDELELFLGGQFLEPGFDYTYVGDGTDYTQISVTFDLLENERLRFRIDFS